VFNYVFQIFTIPASIAN